MAPVHHRGCVLVTALPLSRPVREVRFRPRGFAADAVEAAVEEDGGDAETEQETEIGRAHV